LVAAAKSLVAATTNLFVVPNFVAVTKPFFSVLPLNLPSYHINHLIPGKLIGEVL